METEKSIDLRIGKSFGAINTEGWSAEKYRMIGTRGRQRRCLALYGFFPSPDLEFWEVQPVPPHNYLTLDGKPPFI